MKKIVMAFALGILGVSGAFGVGCGGTDNVAACKDYVATVNGLTCIGNTKVDEKTCDVYKDTTCDISAYFDCVSSHYKCNGDMLDTAEYAKISECADKATCK